MSVQTLGKVVIITGTRNYSVGETTSEITEEKKHEKKKGGIAGFHPR